VLWTCQVVHLVRAEPLALPAGLIGFRLALPSARPPNACSKPAPLCVCADNSASLAEALRNIMMSRRDQVGGAGGGMVVPVAHSIC